MEESVIAPSILSLDYSRMSGQLKKLGESNVKWIYFDVMDGHFIPNLTLEPGLLKDFGKAVDMVMDVHITVDSPSTVAEISARAGADIVALHLEVVKDVDACIQLHRKIREMGAQAGVSVKPKAGVDTLLTHPRKTDPVLIMSMRPGFGGQFFMENMLEKVHILRERIEKEGLDTRVEIDGGIDEEMVKLAVAVRMDAPVAGNYVFRNGIAESVDKLLACQK